MGDPFVELLTNSCEDDKAFLVYSSEYKAKGIPNQPVDHSPLQAVVEFQMRSMATYILLLRTESKCILRRESVC